eukprot:TRINITY_DN14872_c1_g1_i1.p1 TRINITY_DN14872_c1_g1~~TRINITY_DN14872_c1_g1_i1.p1  ORF type:complete len:256 (+),score=19.17 TRINITY_DN14872_c1_g1_i1:43-810(+)
MGCEGSKDAPSGGARPQRYDQPAPQYHQPPQQYHDPGYNQSANPYRTPAPQPSHRSNGYNDGYSRQNQLEAQEHQEVERARAAIARANSFPSRPAYQTPPPQQPNYQPQPQYDQYDQYDGSLQRANTARLLNEQRYATIEQLAEVYPNLDREVIRGVVHDCGGDQERCHTVLSELSGNQGTPSRLGRSMSGSPNRHGVAWECGAAVDARFQGQWYTAVVEGIENNGDYRVKWTSDGSSTLVTPDDIRHRQGYTSL